MSGMKRAASEAIETDIENKKQRSIEGTQDNSSTQDDPGNSNDTAKSQNNVTSHGDVERSDAKLDSASGSHASANDQGDPDDSSDDSSNSDSDDTLSAIDSEAPYSDHDDDDDFHDVDLQALRKAETMKKMSLQRTVWTMMTAEEARNAYDWVALEEDQWLVRKDQFEAYKRKKIFEDKKEFAKTLTRAQLEGELAQTYRYIDHFRQMGKRSRILEDTVNAFIYVLDDEVGEERARKEISRERKREAIHYYMHDIDVFEEEHEKLIAEVGACISVIEKKRHDA